MLNAFARSRTRAVSFGLLLVVVSCTAFGRSSRQDEEQGDARGWPRVIETPDGRITVYEPQLESLKGSHLTSRSAISVTPTGTDAPVFGGLWLDARLEIDEARRTATPVNVKVTEIRFPNLDAAAAGEWREVVASEFLRWKLIFSLDRLLSELKQLEERKAAAQALKAEVPQILFRAHPAVLLVIEGEPAWRDLPDASYRRIANSAFFVVQEKGSGICFLRIAPFWWVAKGPMGPWEPIDEPPAAIAELWKNEPKPQLPSAEAGEDAPTRPEVIPVSQPAELIWTDGLPQYAPISGTDLLYVKNTESDVFMDIRTQHSYVLLSGRWYRTAADKVEWEFVPADLLPPDFSRIPLSSEKAHVLACVAGTAQAREAVQNTAIPQTEAVKPGPAPDLAVSYDGEPQFTEVPSSPVRYAANTSYAVFFVYGRYYLCEDGIWYESDWAVGPWTVCVWVPPVIYLIPPSCPYYYVTYCRIFSVTPSAIYCGYYPGYRGCYVWGGTVVYGTGWRYRCWSGSYWVPRPVTWGCGVRYSYPSCSWTVRLGGAGTCAWTGFSRVSSWRAPSVSVGAGGCWTGVGYRRGDVDVHRQMRFLPPPRPNQGVSLYTRQPERIVPRQQLPPGRVHPGPSGRKNSGEGFVNPRSNPPSGTGSERHPPQSGHGDRPQPPPTAGRRESPSAPTPPVGHAPPSVDRPEGPRKAPLPPPRENPRTPPASSDRESPRTPPPAGHPEGPRKAPQPPPREHRESPKAPPSPPPREYREAPKSPPPPPPPREHRDPPRQPPPPPPREHRDPPRQPPPPPPPREHRDPPRQPPPPPREHRDPPRQPPPPPPPREHRDHSKEPPRSPGRR